MNVIFLIGYMGCGKSTLGRKLARRLGVAFADTDALVEQQEGASVKDVFHYEGEEHFREAEREALEKIIAKKEDVVVSTGGGLPVWKDNMIRMNAVGSTIYLQRSAEKIARRLSPYGRQKRPRLRGLDDERLVEFMARDIATRKPYYMQATMTVDCDAINDGEVVERIFNLVKEINDRTGVIHGDGSKGADL